MHRIAVCNLKGGVGTTTLTFNLAAALAEDGHSVLAIDADPQGCLTRCFDADTSDGPTLAEVLRGQATVATAALRTRLPGVWLVASSPKLGPIHRRNMAGERVLQARMDDSCDVLLIDCPASPGVLLANAFTVATGVLVPVQARGLARSGIGRLLTAVREVRDRGGNPELDVIGLLLNQLQPGSDVGAQISESIRDEFGALVFEQPVHDSERLAETVDVQQPITTLAPGGRAAEEIRNAARELSQRSGVRRGYFAGARRAASATPLRVVAAGAERPIA